jgi:hypothetical protein
LSVFLDEAEDESWEIHAETGAGGHIAEACWGEAIFGHDDGDGECGGEEEGGEFDAEEVLDGVFVSEAGVEEGLSEFGDFGVVFWLEWFGESGRGAIEHLLDFVLSSCFEGSVLIWLGVSDESVEAIAVSVSAF